MRVKLIGLGALLVGALGCFEAVSERTEAEAVADALTRGLRFNGGEVHDGDMPDTTDDFVTILPPSVPTVMSPGQVSLMSFEAGDSGDPETEADETLFQFQGARKHIRARPDSKSSDGVSPWHYEHSFTVDADVCDKLCNKQHAVKMKVALKLRNGVSRSHTVDMTLDCSEDGDENECERHSGDVGDLPSTTYLQACQNASNVCAGFASDMGVSSDVGECAALYQCVQGFFTGDSLCQGLMEELVQCMADADSSSACDACSSVSDQLMSNCTFPEVCLGLPFDSLDAGLIAEPADAGVRPPIGELPLTDSLAENCAAMCQLGRQLCPADTTDTCESDCEGPFVGTVCEQAVVEFQRCSWMFTASPDGFQCGDAGMAFVPADSCPKETQAITDCVIANPDVFGSLPSFDAGQQFPDGGT